METKIELPQGASARLEGGTLTVSGKAGSASKSFDRREVSLSVSGNTVLLSSESKTCLNTAEAHVRNLLSGANLAFSKKMRIIYSHFPIAIEVKGPSILIKNFLGEKKPRTCQAIGATKVSVSGKEMSVSGPSREDVGQTIANIRTATRIRNRDSRVFQDGIYPFEE